MKANFRENIHSVTNGSRKNLEFYTERSTKAYLENEKQSAKNCEMIGENSQQIF